VGSGFVKRGGGSWAAIDASNPPDKKGPLTDCIGGGVERDKNRFVETATYDSQAQVWVMFIPDQPAA
jgi:hypothetical protein